MALVEIDEQRRNTDENAPVSILLALRKRLSLRFLGEYKPFPKLFYRRCKEHGYSFWTNENDCSIEDYIRYESFQLSYECMASTKQFIITWTKENGKLNWELAFHALDLCLRCRRPRNNWIIKSTLRARSVCCAIGRCWATIQRRGKFWFQSDTCPITTPRAIWPNTFR